MKTWQSPEWKKNRDEFLQGKFCAWHESPVKAEVPHHPQKEGSISDAEYLSLKDCIPLCKRCHFAARKGLKLCPVCKEHYYKPKRGRDPMCWNCFSKTPFGARVKQYYDTHPEFKKRRRHFSPVRAVFLSVASCSHHVFSMALGGSFSGFVGINGAFSGFFLHMAIKCSVKVDYLMPGFVVDDVACFPYGMDEHGAT